MNIIIWAILFFSILIPIALLRLKHLRKQAVLQMQQKLTNENILMMDDKAIFYGQKSRGLIHAMVACEALQVVISPLG